MSDITPILAGATAPTYKMSIEDVVKTLQTYAPQADSSLATLQSSIEKATEQINEWKRMQLMLMGQKHLIAELLNKAVDAPAPIAVDVPAKPTT